MKTEKIQFFEIKVGDKIKHGCNWVDTISEIDHDDHSVVLSESGLNYYPDDNDEYEVVLNQ